MGEYRSNRRAVHSCKYHVIWCPKYRRPILSNGADERLKAILRQVARESRVEILELEVMPDHLHLLLEIPPRVGLSRLVRLMKGRSSRMLRAEFPALAAHRSLWAPSFFVATVGGAPLAVVKRYIAQQKAAA